jgi:CheY-like chemotaxis protein
MILKDTRIFIIEDNVTNRAIMQTILERQGAVIGFERWGVDTEERLLKFAPVDIILLDLMFPNDISGYDIFDRIRLLPNFAGVPIVAVSASHEIARARLKGFAGFIKKPIELEQFPRQVASVIAGKPVWV